MRINRTIIVSLFSYGNSGKTFSKLIFTTDTGKILSSKENEIKPEKPKNKAKKTAPGKIKKPNPTSIGSAKKIKVTGNFSLCWSPAEKNTKIHFKF
jgi:hypothetical protein